MPLVIIALAPKLLFVSLSLQITKNWASGPLKPAFYCVFKSENCFIFVFIMSNRVFLQRAMSENRKIYSTGRKKTLSSFNQSSHVKQRVSKIKPDGEN